MAQLRIGVLVDQFPELSETFIASELHELSRLGHDVQVEARARAHQPNPESARGLAVAHLDGDSRGRRLVDAAWLALRHPLACLRDVISRRRWRREEDVAPLRRIAPSARRLARFRADHMHAHFAAGAALNAMRIS